MQLAASTWWSTSANSPRPPSDVLPEPELRHSVVVDVSGEADGTRLVGKELIIGLQ